MKNIKVVYVITNLLNAKKYVGQTNNLKRRINEHRVSDYPIGLAYKKYGAENFTVDIIDKDKSIDIVNEKEVYWINELNTIAPNGYNIVMGGDGIYGYKHTEVSKNKMRKKVIQLETKIVFNSLSEASEKTNISIQGISKACSGDLQTSGGYHWAFFDENNNYDSYKIEPVQKKGKSVINLDTGEVFKTIKEASTCYNLHSSNIIKTCQGKNSTCGGFRWSYLKDKESEA